MERNLNTKNIQTDLIEHLITQLENFTIDTSTEPLPLQDFLILADYFETEFMFDKALEIIDQATVYHGINNEMILRKASLFLQLKDNKAAQQALDEIEVEGNEYHEVLLLRAQCLIAEHQYDAAFEMIKLPFRNGTPEERIQSALLKVQIFEAMKDYNAMFGTIKYILEKDATNEAAMNKLWDYMESQRSYQQGIFYLNQLLDKDPYSYLAWFNLGQAYSCTGEYDNALAAYEYAYIINSAFEPAFRECAELSYELGKYKIALNVYLEILDNFGPDAEIFANIGSCYLQLKQYKQARMQLRKAMKLDPYNDEVLYNLGKCFMAENKYEVALQYFLRAIRIEDSLEDYMVAAAMAYHKLGEVNKANYYFIKATETGPEQPQIWLEQIKFLYQINEFEKALEVIEDSENFTYAAELYYARTALLIAMDKKDEALKQLGEALIDDFYAHRSLFGFDKSLSKDHDIISLINYYQPEE